MPPEWTHGELLDLARFSTPTLSNALELCTRRSPLEGFNREPVRDFTPEQGPMAGFAVTALYCASRRARGGENRTLDLVRAVEAAPKPVIVAVRDVDSPGDVVGALWGECFASICRALGAVGTLTDGAVRDLPELRRLGFHVLARRLCVSHAFGHVVAVNEPVEVFGTHIEPGVVLHADLHGFIALPGDCGRDILAAAEQVERCEARCIIAPTHEAGYTAARFDETRKAFAHALRRGGDGPSGPSPPDKDRPGRAE